MSLPTGLVRLGLTLPVHTEQATDRAEELAHLAGRLGYWAVWLPFETGQVLTRLRRLADRAAPAQVGIVLLEPATSLLHELRSLPPSCLVELDPPDDRDATIDALGGSAAWQTRVHVRMRGTTIDLDAAGAVVPATTRPDVHARLMTAAADRLAAGRSASNFSLAVSLTVSIGRTAREAEARARRDASLAGANHPGVAGLFGSLEQAQEQALELRRAGADTFRATLADEHDIADLLAQLRAVVVGPTPVLHERTG